MRLLKVILAILYPFTVFPQDPGKGLLLDDPAYKENIRRQYIGPAFTDQLLPVKYSLREYCPIAGNQGNMGSCVGWSVGYGAYSILYAVKADNRDRQQITANAYSALYLYNQIKISDCGSGAHISRALLFSKQQGDCFKSLFHPDNCFAQPSPSIQTFKAKDYQALFYGNESRQIKLNAVKQKVADRIPVIIGFQTNSLFSSRYITRENPVWRAGGSGDDGHAVVITGYDDETGLFEILNSWGTDFGDDGFFYMRYDDFIIYTHYAAAMVLFDTAPTINIKGECMLRYFDPGSQRLQDVLLSRAGNEYRTATNQWPMGSIFQLLVKNTQQNQYIYVLSINDKKETKIHFPRRKEFNNITTFDEVANESALFTQSRSTLFIPNEKTGLQLNTRDEYLCILNSKSEIPDFGALVADMKRIRTEGASFPASVQRAIGQRLMTANETSFNSNAIAFSASTSVRDIVPVIIHLKGI